jgi:hypothetical protein
MKKLRGWLFLLMAAFLLAACLPPPSALEIPHRESLIPADAPQMSPENDIHPPVSFSDEFEQPVPLAYPVNTRGFEDSAFILPDGNTLYFWYTPDGNREVIQQATNLVTGIYVTRLVTSGWSEPERVWLSEPGKAVLDGCAFILDDLMWFCTVREGVSGMQWFTANKVEGVWTNWQPADFDPAYEVGELHIIGETLYFHSARAGGLGGMDIWMSQWQGDNWSTPENVRVVNTEKDDGFPALSSDGNELWISRDYGLWRSLKVKGEWQTPVLMISPLAGEATLDAEGNVYFTHHYYDEAGEQALGTDIYVAFRKP